MENSKSDMSPLFPSARNYDCITVGRANLDLYPPKDEHLNSTRSYEAFVGGSPANIAAGLAKLGLQSSLITRVADDDLGQFVVRYLSSKFKIDCSQIQYDRSGAKTSLAFAERRPDAATIMYRNNSSDLLLDPQQIQREHIAQSRSVCVSGTALTKAPSRDAVLRVLEYARASDCTCIIDIDYRPYGWSSYKEASTVLTSATKLCDIVLGTEQECAIACGQTVPNHPPARAAQERKENSKKLADILLAGNGKLVIIKRGEHGSSCYLKDGSVIDGPVFPVEPVKPWGAGDAFASAFLGYLLLSHSVPHALEAGAAAAAINITGLSCTEAMPTREELEQYIQTRRQDAKSYPLL